MMNEITIEEAVKIIKSLEFYDRPFDNTCEQSKTKIALLMAIEALEQQPFINKPCISEGVCREDKIQVLDKIRSEIENHCGLTKENHCKYCYYCNSVIGVREILAIIDKYKAESEDVE